MSGVVCLAGGVVLPALIAVLAIRSALSIAASTWLVLGSLLLVATFSGAVGGWQAMRAGARRTGAVQAGVAGTALAILLLTLVGVVAEGSALAGLVSALVGVLGAGVGARLGTRSALP